MTRIAWVALWSSVALAGPNAAGEPPLSCPSGTQLVVNEDQSTKEEYCGVPAPVAKAKWRREGPYRRHRRGETRSEGQYVGGGMDGVWRDWNEAGQLLYESHWKAGAQEGTRRHWYPNGKLAEETHWLAGKQVGLARAWYETGELKEESKLDDGGRELEWAAYAPGGRRRTNGPCVDDGDCTLIPNPICRPCGAQAWAAVTLVDQHNGNVPQPPGDCPTGPHTSCNMPNPAMLAACKAGKCTAVLNPKPTAY